MAVKYVRSTDGNNADDGSTWALADADLHTPTYAAGDVIYVSDAHAQSTAAAITIDTNGTNASPTSIICGDDAAEPPTSLSTAGTVTTTGNGSHLLLYGSCYIYGLTFSLGSSGLVSYCYLGVEGDNQNQVLDSCNIRIEGSHAASYISIGTSNNSVPPRVVLKNTGVRFTNADHCVNVTSGGFFWEGGSILSGSTALTGGLIRSNSLGEYATARVSGVDLSNLGSASYLTAVGGNGVSNVIFRNCKLPASWTGALTTGTPLQLDRVEMHNCDSTDTNYRLWIEAYAGSIRSETTIVRTGGASDGTTTLAWKMATTANAEFPLMGLTSGEMVIWNDTTGSSKTVTVEIVHDSQGAGSGSKFQDDEIWLEVMYLGTSGFPVGTWISDSKVLLATAANQADSSETWTTTGLTTPVKQALAVTFTPQEKGYIHARVVMAKASKVCYVDPELTVT